MNTIVADIPMSQNIHWRCPETRDPFLRAFRAEAAVRYERIQAERRRAKDHWTGEQPSWVALASR